MKENFMNSNPVQARPSVPRNKGRLTDQKAPLKLKKRTTGNAPWGEKRTTGSCLAMQHYPCSESSWSLTILLVLLQDLTPLFTNPALHGRCASPRDHRIRLADAG